MIKILDVFAGVWLLVSSCGQLKCLEDTEENNNTCMINHFEPSQLVQEVKICKNGLICNSTKSYEVMTCTNRTKRDEEKCENGSDCYSNICDNFICKGKEIGENCFRDEECRNNLFCDKTCRNFINAGDECIRMMECPFGYGCGSKTEGGSMKCRKLYSIPNG